MDLDLANFRLLIATMPFSSAGFQISLGFSKQKGQRPMSYEIRPLGVGGILDQGFRLFRDNLGLMVITYSAMYVPPQIVLVLTTRMLAPDPAALQSMTPEQQLAAMGASTMPLLITMVLSIIAFVVFTTVGEGAVCYAAAHRYLDEPVTPGEAISAGFSRMWPLIWTGLLKTIFIMIGLIFLIIPGVYLAFRYAFASQAVVLEGLSGGDALRRSGDLMRERKHFAQMFVLGLAFWVIGIGIGMVLGMLGQGLVFQLLNVLVTSAVASGFASILVVFYFSSRCRIDGFDLKLLAQQLEGKVDSADGRY